MKSRTRVSPTRIAACKGRSELLLLLVNYMMRTSSLSIMCYVRHAKTATAITVDIIIFVAAADDVGGVVVSSISAVGVGICGETGAAMTAVSGSCCWVGTSVSTGAKDGNPVGDCDMLGTSVGEVDGMVVGIGVGFLVGAILGDQVGCRVGAGVGDQLGFGVGGAAGERP